VLIFIISPESALGGHAKTLMNWNTQSNKFTNN